MDSLLRCNRGCAWYFFVCVVYQESRAQNFALNFLVFSFFFFHNEMFTNARGITLII